MNAVSLSNQRLSSRRAVAPLPGELARDGMLAGLLGGMAMTTIGVLLALSYGYDVWVPVKALGSLVLGPAALVQAGFVAGPVFAGLLIHLVVAALLGAIFGIVARRFWRLPSDFGVPAVSGLVFGLLVWLVAYLTMPTLLPQLRPHVGSTKSSTSPGGSAYRSRAKRAIRRRASAPARSRAAS